MLAAMHQDQPLLDALARRFLHLQLESRPVWATQMGHHEGDHRLPDHSAAGRQRQRAARRELRGALEALSPEALAPGGRVDRQILLERLDLEDLEDDELRPLERDPWAWSGQLGAGLHGLVTRDFAPLGERAEAFRSRLQALPDFLATARATLADVSAVHLDAALAEVPGLKSLVHHLDEAAGIPDDLPQVAAAAEASLDEWEAHLREGLAPHADPEGWRLGEELWEKKAALTLESELTAHDLQEETMNEVVRCLHHLEHHAAALLGEGDGAPGPYEVMAPVDDEGRARIRRGLERLAADRPAPGELVEACRRAVEECRAFVVERGLVGPMPPDVLHVEEWPEHSRGVAVACLSAPGPYERAEAESYFYISPVEASWDPARVESYLREYNHSQLVSLAAHEAYPGHFVQLAVARAGATPTRSLLSSGSFAEGWAMYCETLMLDEGLREGDHAYAMAVWKMRLRTALNAVLDRSLHCGQRSPAEGERMLREGGFQEEAEAKGKVRRAQLTSTQLSTYFAGHWELQALRAEAEAHRGAAFDLVEFHRQLLENGTVASRHQRVLLGLPAA